MFNTQTLSVNEAVDFDIVDSIVESYEDLIKFQEFMIEADNEEAKMMVANESAETIQQFQEASMEKAKEFLNNLATKIKRKLIELVTFLNKKTSEFVVKITKKLYGGNNIKELINKIDFSKAKDAEVTISVYKDGGAEITIGGIKNISKYKRVLKDITNSEDYEKLSNFAIDYCKKTAVFETKKFKLDKPFVAKYIDILNENFTAEYDNFKNTVFKFIDVLKNHSNHLSDISKRINKLYIYAAQTLQMISRITREAILNAFRVIRAASKFRKAESK